MDSSCSVTLLKASDPNEPDAVSVDLENFTFNDHTSLSCRLCRVLNFESSKEQREHFQTEWHMFNLRRKMNNNSKLLSEEEYENVIAEDNEAHLDSAASRDDFSENLQEYRLKRTLDTSSRCFLLNEHDQVISCYRNAIDMETRQRLEVATPVLLKDFFANLYWIIFVLAGGNFVGAVYRNMECVCHKTLHRYTIRAKQGGAQSSRDAQQSLNRPKSAGAQLRRYNEFALKKDIDELLRQWHEHLSQAKLVFLRHPSYYKQVFFGAEKWKLSENDARIRRVPFATRKPTLKECERIFKQLTSLDLEGDRTAFLRTLQQQIQTSTLQSDNSKDVTTTASNENLDCGCSESRKVKLKQHVVREREPSAAENVLSKFDQCKPRLYTACKTGQADIVEKVISEMLRGGSGKEDVVAYLCSPVLGAHGDQATTLLHQACQSGYKDVVRLMLHLGCDATSVDHRSRTAFQVCTSPALTQLFWTHRLQTPDFDWRKAGMPEHSQSQPSDSKCQQSKQKPALTDKHKLQKTVKAEKLRQKQLEREAEERRKLDEQRFSQLSDREKRALAAERRLLAQCQQQGHDAPVLQRCHQCAADMTARVPFEYYDFRFCSTKCLNEHKKGRAGDS